MNKSYFDTSDPDELQLKQSSKEQKKQERLATFSVKEFVEQISEDLRANKIYLPTIPTLALEALLVINDAGSSASDLEKVISRDTALTARLIRYANSPLYHGTQPVTAIKLAITRIGFQRVKNAVYAVSMKEVFRTSAKDIERRMDALWEHSVIVGSQASILAKKQPHLDSDIALVAGLVHDIGKIPLLIKACDHKELVENPDYLDKLVHKLHPQLGSTITKQWKFDPTIVKVIAEHEMLDRNPGNQPVDYVDVVQVANILAYDQTDHPLARIDRSAIRSFQRIGFSGNQEDVDMLMEDSKAIADVIF